MRKTNRHYKCNWPNCPNYGKDFTKDVGVSSGGKHQTESSQVKCDSCGNFLKTWED